jgi:hypothetical protein
MKEICYNCEKVRAYYETKQSGIFPFNSTSLYRGFVCTLTPPSGTGFPNVKADFTCDAFKEASQSSIWEREKKERSML